MIILKYIFDRYEGSKKRCGIRLNLYTYIYLSTRAIVNLSSTDGRVSGLRPRLRPRKQVSGGRGQGFEVRGQRKGVSILEYKQAATSRCQWLPGLGRTIFSDRIFV